MNKAETKEAILLEVFKEVWDISKVAGLAMKLNERQIREENRQRLSNALPAIAAEVCGLEMHDLITGRRKGLRPFACQLVFKELRENHGKSFQSIATRFARSGHDTVLQGVKSINNRLETNDPESLRLFQEFQRKVALTKILIEG